MLPNWLYGKSKSKLANILGVPSDYAQVKAQVTQNAEDIEELTEKKVDILTKWLPTLMSTAIEDYITDLDTPLTSPTQNGMLGFNRYSSSASNKPINKGGVVLTWETSNIYGCQLVLSECGLYFRTNQNGTVSSWKEVAFTT